MVSSRCASIVKSVPRASARSLILLAALLALTGVAPVRAADYEGGRISSIQFDPATQPLVAPELQRLVDLKPGDTLRMAQVSAAIQRLFATGRYADIAVDATRVDSGIAIRFVTQANYFVGNVDVQGAPDPPNKGQLVTAMKLQLGSVYEGYDLRQATENLQTRLRANGLFNAEVAPQRPSGSRSRPSEDQFHNRSGKPRQVRWRQYRGRSGALREGYYRILRTGGDYSGSAGGQ